MLYGTVVVCMDMIDQHLPHVPSNDLSVRPRPLVHHVAPDLPYHPARHYGCVPPRSSLCCAAWSFLASLIELLFHRAAPIHRIVQAKQCRPDLLHPVLLHNKVFQCLNSVAHRAHLQYIYTSPDEDVPYGHCLPCQLPREHLDIRVHLYPPNRWPWSA